MSKLVILSLLLAASAQAGGIQTKPLNAFNDTTIIPRDATDVTVTQVKRVQVPTQENDDYSTCDDFTIDPSPIDCPTVTYSNNVLAIQISYTYNAQSTSVGEDGSPFNEDTFTLDPSTLTATQLNAVPAKGALKGKAAQAVASVTTHVAGEPVQVVDWANSKICDTVVTGDGEVTQVDPTCVDQYAYKTITKNFNFAIGALN